MNKIVDLSEQDLVEVMLERDVLKADVARLTALLARAERQLASRARSCRTHGCHFERAKAGADGSRNDRPSLRRLRRPLEAPPPAQPRP